MTQMLTPASWGVGAPWTLIASGVVGASMMLAPPVLGMTGTAARSNQVIGAVIVTIAVIATAEVVRALRFLNVVVGVWVAASGWILSGAGTGGRVKSPD